jgi:hypothetical protein
MKRTAGADYRKAAALLVAAMMCGGTLRAQQDSGYWRAASNNALAITGDLHITAAKITVNFVNFPLAQIRTLKPEEVSAVFDADANAGLSGNLYRLTVPAEQRFLRHNTLCGHDDTEWMATWASGRSLQVAFFSGTDAPVLTVDALAHTSDLCGTFTYAR